MSNNVFGALVKALRDRVQESQDLDPVPESARLDGKTCLVTGANSGIGKAVALDLAQRGAQLILICRSGIPDTADEIRAATGNDNVEMLYADLSDTRSVHDVCDLLREQGVRIDIAVLNAGLMPAHAIKTPQGYESMFAVHFLANRIMVARWLEDQVIVPSSAVDEHPRIIIVSSQSHQSAEPISFESFGEFVDFGVRDGLKFYGASKLVSCTYAQELSRRLNPDGALSIAVHSLCPGPVYTNIARDAPWFLMPLANFIMKLGFQSPTDAAKSVIYLCCAPEAGRDTGRYHHMMRVKPLSPYATDIDNGKRLWELSEPMIQRK